MPQSNYSKLTTLIGISKLIDQTNRWIGTKISWLSLALVLLICTDVVLRYLFSNTQTWVIELEWHLFGLLFLFGAAYTLLSDEHVRVDLYYNNKTERQKASINLIGTLVLLLPWCYIVIGTSLNYGLNSFSFLEGSPNPNGLPARYIIKFAICVAFVLLALQAISEIIKSIQIIRKN